MKINVSLAYFAGALVALNVVAAGMALVFNWPAQFGGVGTDASSEFLVRGTAVSAPLAPVVALIVTAVCAGRRDGWGWVGIAAAVLTAPAIFVGGVGELVAPGTVDTPKEILAISGSVAAVLAVSYFLLATAAATERVRSKRSRRVEPV